VFIAGEQVWDEREFTAALGRDGSAALRPVLLLQPLRPAGRLRSGASTAGWRADDSLRCPPVRYGLAAVAIHHAQQAQTKQRQRGWLGQVDVPRISRVTTVGAPKITVPRAENPPLAAEASCATGDDEARVEPMPPGIGPVSTLE